MSIIAIVAITLVSAFFISKLFFRNVLGPQNQPKGSLGYPIIGETISFLQAQKKDQGPQWINQRVAKYGPVFKTSLLGSSTVVIVGQAGNKFILGSDVDVLGAKQPKTVTTIAGKYNIFELTGSRANGDPEKQRRKRREALKLGRYTKDEIHMGSGTRDNENDSPSVWRVQKST